MIKTYKNKVTGIKAVYQGGNSFKVIDASEPDDTNNIVMVLSARDISTSKYWMPDLQEPEGVKVISMTNKYNLTSGEYWVRTDKGFKWSSWKEGNTMYYSAKDLLSSDDINKIYSVKRLSDGVIFTVGDKIDGKLFKNITIDSFEIGESVAINNGAILLADAKHHIDEVKSKYEITSFRMASWKSLVLTLRETGEYVREDKPLNWGGYSLETMLRDCTIESVKRLSDSVIFTVDDKVCWDWSACSSDYFTIDGFKIIDGEMRAMIRLSDNCVTDYRFFDTEKNEKYNFRHYVEKKVVFVSEDGVNMYDGDTYHYILNDGVDTGILNATTTARGIYNSGLFLRFSTKEACQAYINKRDEDTELVDVKLTKKEVVKLKELLK